MKDSGFFASIFVVVVVFYFTVVFSRQEAPPYTRNRSTGPPSRGFLQVLQAMKCMLPRNNVDALASRFLLVFQATLPEKAVKLQGLHEAPVWWQAAWIGNLRQVINFTKWCQTWGRHNSICNEVTRNLIILKSAQVSFISKPLRWRRLHLARGRRVSWSGHRMGLQSSTGSSPGAEGRNPAGHKQDVCRLEGWPFLIRV